MVHWRPMWKMVPRQVVPPSSPSVWQLRTLFLLPAKSHQHTRTHNNKKKKLFIYFFLTWDWISNKSRLVCVCVCANYVCRPLLWPPILNGSSFPDHPNPDPFFRHIHPAPKKIYREKREKRAGNYSFPQSRNRISIRFFFFVCSLWFDPKYSLIISMSFCNRLKMALAEVAVSSAAIRPSAYLSRVIAITIQIARTAKTKTTRNAVTIY